VAPNDFLYVTDQNTNNIKVLNAARQLVGTIPTGPVPSGATIGPDGALYYTDTPAQTPDGFIGRLVRVDLATQQQTVIFDDLAFPMDVEFAPDGSYYLATRSGREIDHYASNNVFINSFSDGVISDQLAFYAPEPASSAVLITVATAAAMQRRRHRR
jgi:DNA-binding beta-propeller fold protein YncE